MPLDGEITANDGGYMLNLKRIISGGQTGVDRAALDAALESGFPCGGWCPEGRLAEDGVIHERYPLVELPGAGYKQRTLKNVLEADGTVIIHFGHMESGTKSTAIFCIRTGKPHELIDGDRVPVEQAVALLFDFITEGGIHVLNIAGPRATTKPQAYVYARAVVGGILRRLSR